MIPDDWTFVESVPEYETGWYTGGYDRYRQPDGTEKDYYWAELPPAVVVVAREGAEVVMVEQFRPAIERYCLELPAGIVEDVDSPSGSLAGGEDIAPEAYESAAARELAEETGYHPEETLFLDSFWTSTGVLRHRRGIVFATDLTETDRALDTNEFITVRRVPLDGLLARVREDPANDATIEGVLLARADGLL
ncbi:NUDIX domain-containing protein [Halomarina oriensis]|uniref:NUDIX domain-containing protein n=2 Tax=Halomarina oriensis TaxID=671145 RepID=A0A6B0GRC1_9EURY|nr:NUDIX hydrolase [Halomarina oriensis]MWG36651.1 NUDIX domain-containing protein [Halomarina oriensis]